MGLIEGNCYDGSVTEINPMYPQPCPVIENHTVTFVFERYF